MAAGVTAGLNPRQLAWLAATPLQEPATAGWIARRANRLGSGQAFAMFARGHQRLFERMFVHKPGPHYMYRLSAYGRAMLDFEPRT